MSRELLQQALDALGTSTWDHTSAVGKQELIDALREALNAPEPEPVAEVFDTFGNSQDPNKAVGHVWLKAHYFPPKGTKLYAAAPPAAPAPAVPDDAAMTLLKELRHALEPISAYGRVGTRDVEQAKLQHLVAMIDRVLSAAPAVREPQYWCPETGELCGKCAKTGTCEASILQAHGIGGGGNHG